jgi:hypothetical protein
MSSQASELSAARAELEAERSAQLEKLSHLEGSNDMLRLGQGKFQQQLALKEQALEKEREMAQEMRRRLHQLNQTYLSSGAPLAAPCQVAALLCLLRPSLGPCQSSSSPALLHPPPAGDKLRSQMSSQASELSTARAELEAERSAQLEKLSHLEGSNDMLRLGQGKFQQELAKREQELEKEREMAQEMRNRLKRANTTYLTTGVWRAAAALRCAAPHCAPLHWPSHAPFALACALTLPAPRPAALQATRCATRWPRRPPSCSRSARWPSSCSSPPRP